LDEYFEILNKNYLSQISENDDVVGEVRHLWWPLVNPVGEYKNTQKITNYTNIKYISCGNSIIDKWVSDYYKHMGVKNIIGINCAEFFDLWIYGNYLVQTILPKELITKIDEYFNKPATFSEFDTSQFLKDVFEYKCNIKLIITFNPLFAKHLKDKILTYFKEE